MWFLNMKSSSLSWKPKIAVFGVRSGTNMTLFKYTLNSFHNTFVKMTKIYLVVSSEIYKMGIKKWKISQTKTVFYLLR